MSGATPRLRPPPAGSPHLAPVSRRRICMDHTAHSGHNRRHPSSQIVGYLRWWSVTHCHGAPHQSLVMFEPTALIARVLVEDEADALGSDSPYSVGKTHIRSAQRTRRNLLATCPMRRKSRNSSFATTPLPPIPVALMCGGDGRACCGDRACSAGFTHDCDVVRDALARASYAEYGLQIPRRRCVGLVCNHNPAIRIGQRRGRRGGW